MTAPNVMSWSRAPWGLGWRLMQPPSALARQGDPSEYAMQLGAPSSAPMLSSPPTPPVPATRPPIAPFSRRQALLSGVGGAIRGLGAALNPNGGKAEAFLSALSSAYGATTDAFDRDRQSAQQDQQAQEDRALEARLKGAQADYYERGARGGQATPYHFESIPGLGILRSNEMTGESGLVGPQGGAPYVVPIPGVETARTRTTIMPPKPPHQFAPQFKVGDDGYQYEYNQRTRRWVQSLGADGRPFKPHMGGGGSSGTVGAGLTPRGGATTKPTAEARFNQLANDPANASKTDDELAAMVRAEIQQGKVQPETP